jgi:hypothetical protein
MLDVDAHVNGALAEWAAFVPVPGADNLSCRTLDEVARG